MTARTNKKSGKFIVIDGSDGSGKKTQSDLLIKRLQKEGYKTAYYDFPSYNSFFGQMVGRYLNGEFGEADHVNPYLGSLLYAGDRWQAGNSIKKDLSDGKIVISNRYVQSNMAHQSAKITAEKDKIKFNNWLKKLEFEIYCIPKPDLVIFLHVPVDISQGLFEKKGKRDYTSEVKDIHEKNIDYMKRSVKEYIKLAQTNKEWRQVDCINDGVLLSKEDIAHKIYDILAKELI